MSPPSTDGASSSNTVAVDDLYKKMITLMSSDGESLEVEAKVLLQSQTIKNMIDDDCTANGIPLPNVTGKILAKVIEYLKKHAEDHPAGAADGNAAATASLSDDLKKWNADFVNIDTQTLFGVILAANFLDIKSLLDVTCKTVADYIKDKTVEEVREIFHIVNDFTPEEEAAIRNENKWAFE